MAITSSTWTAVEATIGGAHIQYETVNRTRSVNAKKRSLKKKTVRRLQLNYTYLWKGDTLSSDRITFL